MPGSDLGSIWGLASRKCLIIGLTGGIGAGKTEVANELLRLGAKIVDADEIAKEIARAGTKGYDEIIKEFGNKILDTNGEIDRSLLAREVFSSNEKKRILEEITHPEIFRELLRKVNTLADEMSEDDIPVIVVDAALIVDIGAQEVFDLVIVVTSNIEDRVERLKRVRKMSREEVLSRIHSQTSDEERLKHASIVINNSGTISDLRNEVSKAWQIIEREVNKKFP
ncbi:MAG: dephospho-CoA kinase [Actinomycetota bacterium]|nr:dephospho-CoA kinase [Actinomycetota bacterium]